MSLFLETSIVRIYKQQNEAEIIGAGFLVSENYIVTCAHVVNESLGRNITCQEKPNETQIIEFDFPAIASGKSLTAIVEEWKPVNFSTNDPQDIAILRLQSPLPPKAQPIELVMTEHQDLSDHEFKALGFSRNSGVWTDGKIKGRVADNKIQIQVENLTDYRVEGGFSGTAIWDKTLEGVVGMAVNAEKFTSLTEAFYMSRGAFFIPTDMIIKAFPELQKVAIINKCIPKIIRLLNQVYRQSKEQLELVYAYLLFDIRHQDSLFLPPNLISETNFIEIIYQLDERVFSLTSRLKKIKWLEVFVGYLILEIDEQDGLKQDLESWLRECQKDNYERVMDVLEIKLEERKKIFDMRGLLEDFRASFGNYSQQRLILSENPQFFGVPLNTGVLTALNLPVKAEPTPSCVRLIASDSKKGKVRDLYLLDPEIAKSWGQSLQNVWVYQDQTLASLKIEDLKSGKILWKDIRWIESQDLLLPEFAFIDIEDALPGAFAPNSPMLVFKGQQITPLLPLNPILLDYFTPEDLMRRIQLTPLSGSEGLVMRITLDLPLSGMKNDEKNPQNYRIFKDYPIKEENALTQVPVLEIWPNFRAEGWKEYYVFYYDQEVFTSSQPEDKTFQVELPEAKEPHIFQDGKGLYQITRLEEFPSFVTCQDKFRNLLGLILLKTPTPIPLKETWKVGVDFGTSFTNIYVNRKGVTEPLPLESLHLKVTDVDLETRIRVLIEFFIPESFIPLDKPLPLSSVLTTRKSDNLAKERPIYDGRIYIPEKSFKPQEDWIHTDLRLKNLTMARLFLKNLALLITALAAKNGIKQIQWSLSYPSAFSRTDKTLYARIWQDLTADLQFKTGITHLCPEQDDLRYFRTESLATAQYFADSEGLNLVNSTCINMGDGTSDISIWQAESDRFQLVHQCSVQLAGRHLFSQFLELNPNFLLEKFEVDPTELQGLWGGNFRAKLDVLLRLESEKWLRKIDFLEDDPEFQGLIRLMAIGTAGLYYYVGTILQVLYGELRYKTNEITPVYIGGNGSRLLNWLAIGGRFDRHSEINDLFSRMLSEASGFPDTQETTSLSTRPKDEVACGLVLDKTPLSGLNSENSELIIAGENCLVNDEPIDWNQYLDLEGNITGFKIPQLIQVPMFLDKFNNALTDLDIERISPMPSYRTGVGLDPNYKDKLWRDVHRELTMNLIRIKGDSDNIRVEAPFILGLKALLRVLGKEWAGNNSCI